MGVWMISIIFIFPQWNLQFFFFLFSQKTCFGYKYEEAFDKTQHKKDCRPLWRKEPSRERKESGNVVDERRALGVEASNAGQVRGSAWSHGRCYDLLSAAGPKQEIRFQVDLVQGHSLILSVFSIFDLGSESQILFFLFLPFLGCLARDFL